MYACPAGLLNAIGHNEDKLADVLGHEAAHVVARQGAEGLGVSALIADAARCAALCCAVLCWGRYDGQGAAAAQCMRPCITAAGIAIVAGARCTLDMSPTPSVRSPRSSCPAGKSRRRRGWS